MPLIAVDAMGGDHAPAEVVHGCAAAIDGDVDLVLVGDERLLAPVMDRAGLDVPIVHAGETVQMDEDPAGAIREKKDSSIAVAARLVRSGEVDGLVSAGSTGAAMAAAALLIGRLPGIGRPAIASVFPTGEIVIDAGANLECRPIHLVQFAVMGSAVCRVYRHIDEPRVGLVNIGEEEGKGRDLERETYALLTAAPGINFIGNVEGSDLVTGKADVFVTDGYTGNVLLKTTEGAARGFYRLMLEKVSGEQYQAALAEIAPAFFELRSMLDPEAVGGAHLVGTKGVVVIGHGSSSRVAIANAIAMAADAARQRLVDQISAGITSVEAAHLTS